MKPVLFLLAVLALCSGSYSKELHPTIVHFIERIPVPIKIKTAIVERLEVMVANIDYEGTLEYDAALSFFKYAPLLVGKIVDPAATMEATGEQDYFRKSDVCLKQPTRWLIMKCNWKRNMKRF